MAAGIACFLFIPLVLYLYVVHPEPVALSTAAGVVLMLGHRLLARPYMQRVRGASACGATGCRRVERTTEATAAARG